MPPTLNSYHSSGHGSSSYASDYSYNQQPVNHGYKDTKKGHKKGGGVTDLISGFINSYTKPKKDKVYAPVKVPAYVPPNPLPTYGAPLQTLPKPVYSPPSYSVPTYDSSKFVTPAPIYKAPIPSYSASVHSKPVSHHNHKVNIIKPTVTKIFTRTVSVPAKVEHHHSHQHIYHGAKITSDNSYVDNHHIPSTSYSTQFKKKSDNNEQNVLTSISDPSVSGTSFVSSSIGTGFGTTGTGIIKVPLEAPNAGNTHQNPFDVQHSSSGGNFNSGGFSSHTKFISNNQNFQSQNSFQTNNFQQPQTEFGFKPSITIEDMINQNNIGQFSRTIYRTDCQCISEQYCSAENIVHGQRDYRQFIDARNNKGEEVFSNATEETSAGASTKVPPAPGANRVARVFNIDDYNYSNEETETTTTTSTTSTTTEASSAETDTEQPEVVRKRRDTEDPEDNYEDVQGVSRGTHFGWYYLSFFVSLGGNKLLFYFDIIPTE